MILGVTGSRTIGAKERVWADLDEIHAQTPVTVLLEGGSFGPDQFAEDWAKARGVKWVPVEADWHDFSEPCFVKRNGQGREYNALAGLRRNTRIVEMAEKVVAWWDGRSKGTRDCFTKAGKANKLLKLHTL
jgi:hypothetical protein